MVFNAILTGRQSGQSVARETDGKYLFPELNFSQFVNQNTR